MIEMMWPMRGILGHSGGGSLASKLGEMSFEMSMAASGMAAMAKAG